MEEVEPKEKYVIGVAIMEFIRHFLHVDPVDVQQVHIDVTGVTVVRFVMDEHNDITYNDEYEVATYTTKIPIKWW